jgi:hypothetical protein
MGSDNKVIETKKAISIFNIQIVHMSMLYKMQQKWVNIILTLEELIFDLKEVYLVQSCLQSKY